MWRIYRHYRGALYLKIGTAAHSESLEPLVVYRTLYDNQHAPLWARPREMFFGSVAPDVIRFEEAYTLRVVMPEDEPSVLKFGFDAWGDGRTLGQFIESYQHDLNHQRGTRYLLALPNGVPIANINTLRFARGLVGFASLSVDSAHRRQGHASTLLRAVMELFRMEDPEVRFMLYSEVMPEMYERLGFRRLDDTLQRYPPSVAMATGDAPRSAEEARCLEQYF